MADWTDRTTHTRERFLELLSESGNVRASCAALGLQRSTLYEWRNRDRDFAVAWDAALKLAVDALQDEAMRRAKEGSDVLLMFLLKSLKPERYRERRTIDLNSTIYPDYRNMPIAEIRQRLDELRREQDEPPTLTLVAEVEPET